MGAGIVTGIDIGNTAVKVVSLRRRGARFQVLGAGLAHVPEDLADAPDPAALLGGVVKRLLRTQRIPLGRVVVGLGGRGTMVRCLSEPICPRWKLEMLMGYEVEELAGAGGAGGIAYDFRPLDLPEFEEGQFSVLLAQAQAEVVEERLAIGRIAAGRADEVDMNCLGVGNLYAVGPQCDEEGVALVVDIGAEETAVSLHRGSGLYYARTIGGGGKRFTSRLQKDLGLSFGAAEELKVDRAAILPPPGELEPVDDEAQRVSEACRAEAQTLASAIQSSVVFLRTQLAKSAGGGRNPALEAIAPQKVFVTGGGARLEGLVDFLGERLRLPAEMLDIDATLTERKGSAEVVLAGPQAAHFATAAGLALGRARTDGFQLNLLPESEQARRRFRDRTVYVGATAVAALLFLVLGIADSYQRLSVAQANSERRTRAVEEAREQFAGIEQARARNERLGSMVDALASRRRAGAEVLRCIDLLRRHTPDDMFFVGLQTERLVHTTRPPDTKEGEEASGRGRGRGRGRGGDDEEEDSVTPNRTGRILVLEGYCLAPDERRGIQRVAKLVTDLPAASDGLFRSV
ncbi:MAG: pilus assembly protein PilM, partial [Planctomycetota bacterium]